MEEIIEMSTKEVDRFAVLKQVEQKKLTQVEAAKILGVSDRQIRNLLAKIKANGAKGVISRKRGRPSNNRKPKELKEKVLSLMQTKYEGFGPTFASEKLKQINGLIVNRETLRLWMIEAKIWVVKERKKKPRPLRDRRPCFGELIQVDGSLHLWFGPENPKATLMVFIDDATSKVTALHFCKHENLNDYFVTLESHLKQYGIPRGIYSDRLRVFEGGKNLTQFQQALRSLGTTSILAYSPEAKGRVERVNRTFQDRLIKELALRGITTIEEANKYLSEYLVEHNEKFSVEPASDFNAHRPLEKDHDLERLLCRHETRTLTKDYLIQYNNRFYKIGEDPDIRQPKGRKIEIRTTRNGKLRAFLGQKELKIKPLDRVIEKAPIMNRKEVLAWNPSEKKPVSKNHPWKIGYSNRQIKRDHIRGVL